MTKITQTVARATEDPKTIYIQERAKSQVAVRLADALVQEGCTQRELARRLRLSEGRISQIMSADENVSIELLARIAAALDRQLEVQFPPNRDVNMGLQAWPGHLRCIESWTHPDSPIEQEERSLNG